MKPSSRLSCLAFALVLATGSASAQNLDQLKGMVGGNSASSLTSGSATNAAGIIQYCLKNNFLGGDSGASSVKDKLLGSVTGDTKAAGNDSGSGSATDKLMGKYGIGGKSSSSSATKDKGYTDGANGILKTGDGKSVDLGSLGSGSTKGLSLGSLGGGSSSGGDLKQQLTQKVCDKVLSQGKSMIGM
ncbi:uncharacterized protein DUF2501 [Luteibacter rhizovicinus]|uniref:Uncharacterized protein DUF2501 n=1 Tax=Luteibacter rhizovicinus TaxID=242606 RepID=A0A4R3YJG6_9GAMM|nr:DUF2501 domain-containing protein [Luteibacter rhizovicinus]TCV92360.1 uncharacterized protein DUF2501 [Luteibacter rhizovicinus]